MVSEVKTIQTIADGDFMRQPVIGTGDDSKVEISFDYLSDTQPWLTYTLVHCDAQWRPDGLSEMEFAEGFFPVRITDVKPSFNTFIPYYHYSLSFPNEDVALTASGNYAVLIHPEEDVETVIAVATFSVSEQLTSVTGTISGNTDIDFHQSHQQLSLCLSWDKNKLPYADPASDIFLTVSQNRRGETRRTLTVPTRISAGGAVYEHTRDLIFEATNNYRRFEFTDVRYAVLGVSEVSFESPYYSALLYTDHLRSNGTYLYDKDQDGRFLVHALHIDDETIETEYFKACFRLKAPASLDRQGIYLDGDFTYGQATPEFRMEYDAQYDIFHKDVLLKQGAYNYQYLVNGRTTAIEGNYYETPNEYVIHVYYRPNGARYDRLVGVSVLSMDKAKTIVNAR